MYSYHPSQQIQQSQQETTNKTGRSQAAKFHFKQRCFDRMSLSYSEANTLYSQLIDSISQMYTHPSDELNNYNNHGILFLHKESNNISLYSFTVDKDTYYVVVYNKKLHAPVTIYSENTKFRNMREQRIQNLLNYYNHINTKGGKISDVT